MVRAQDFDAKQIELAPDTDTREDIDALKYSGPMYFDLDGEDIETVIEKAKNLMGKLIGDYDFNPNALRMYATGGRGFHFEIPWETFIPKPSKQGISRLPAIYREMAYELYVDTLDMRVYSARKGRMWRTPGVKRENGKAVSLSGRAWPCNFRGGRDDDSQRGARSRH